MSGAIDGAGPGRDDPGDDERAQVIATLRAHAVDGRLTLEEFAERVSDAYAAVTRSALERVTAGLPMAVTPEPRRRRKASRFVLSLLGGSDRKGRWRVGERLTAVAFMGGNDLDLRHAELDSTEVVITAVAIMGGIDIYVPDSVEVAISGFALAGGNDQRGSPKRPPPGAPIVRVRAYSLMGGIDVWRLPADVPASLKAARRRAAALERGEQMPP